MALASTPMTIVSRSTGRSSVAASSYRSGEELYNEREGITYSYPHKTDIVYTEILLPEHAPERFRDRQTLWNSVELAEKGKNAQTAREFRIALPQELSREQNIALAHAYAQTFAREGMCADLAIHDKGDGNPHAHIMLTMRPLQEDGTWANKCRKAYVLDENGEKIRLASGEYKSRKVDTTDWNTREKLKEWRERYQDMTNEHLNQAGRPERITIKSYKDQGIDREPTLHLGHYAHSLEQAGIATVQGNINRHIQQENRDRENMKAIDQELAHLQEERAREQARLQQAATPKPAPLAPSAPSAQEPSFEERFAAKTKERETRRRQERQREREERTRGP